MTCKACASQPSGSTNRQCRDCQIREIAQGPWFFKRMVTRQWPPQYVAQLRAVFGEACDIVEAHRTVRESAKSIRVGALPA